MSLRLLPDRWPTLQQYEWTICSDLWRVWGLGAAMQRFVQLSCELPVLLPTGLMHTADFILGYMGLEPIALIISCIAALIWREYTQLTQCVPSDHSRWCYPEDIRRGIIGYFPQIEKVMDMQYWSICPLPGTPITRFIYAPSGLDDVRAAVTNVDWITGDRLRVRLTSRAPKDSAKFAFWRRCICPMQPNQVVQHCSWELNVVLPSCIQGIAECREAKDRMFTMSGVDTEPPLKKQKTMLSYFKLE